MRNTIFVIVAMATSGLVQAQNQVQKLRLEVSSGEYGSCDMQPFTGSISIKVCGENCCFRSKLGNFYNLEESVEFSGPSQIGECHNFELGAVAEDAVNVGLYHSGTDLVCFNEVFVFTTGSTLLCDFNNTRLDNNDFFVSKECLILPPFDG